MFHRNIYSTAVCNIIALVEGIFYLSTRIILVLELDNRMGFRVEGIGGYHMAFHGFARSLPEESLLIRIKMERRKTFRKYMPAGKNNQE